eukprot:12433631-Prorocentrum_lima.AAC.1
MGQMKLYVRHKKRSNQCATSVLARHYTRTPGTLWTSSRQHTLSLLSLMHTKNLKRLGQL